MSQRALVTALVVAVVILGVAIWFRQTSQPQQQAATAAPPAGQEAPGSQGGTPGGMPPGNMPPGNMPPGNVPDQGEPATPSVAWTVPARWTQGSERPMRLATYTIPAATGAAPAECAVFHFGPHQGGTVDDNIARWIGQFENPSQPKRSQQQVNGLAISRVEVDGTYLAPAGPNMAPSGQNKNYRLLGAIVTGPNGLVFFKLTGPVPTVERASKDFDAMLKSIHKV